MKFLKPLTVIATAIPLALTGCVTDPVTGQQSASKTAMYGLGGAAVCGPMAVKARVTPHWLAVQ